MECAVSRTVFLLDSPSSPEPFYNTAGTSNLMWNRANLWGDAKFCKHCHQILLLQVNMWCLLRFEVLMVEVELLCSLTAKGHRNM